MESEVEIWKPIPEYEGYYEASSLGRIRSVNREITRNDGKVKKWGSAIKKPYPFKGYLSVRLCKNHEGKNFLVHRLVALAFLSNPNNLPEINHKNGIREDNSVENLEWISRIDNQRHSWHVLGRKVSDKLKSSFEHTKRKKYKTVLNIETGIYYDSIIDAAKSRNVVDYNLWRVLNSNRNNTKFIIV